MISLQKLFQTLFIFLLASCQVSQASNPQPAAVTSSSQEPQVETTTPIALADHSLETQTPTLGLYERNFEPPKSLFENYKKGPLKQALTVDDLEYNEALHVKAFDFFCAERYKEESKLTKKLEKQNELFAPQCAKELNNAAQNMISYIDEMKKSLFKNPLITPPDVPEIKNAATQINGITVILKHITPDGYEQVYEKLTMECAKQFGIFISSEENRREEIKRWLNRTTQQQQIGNRLNNGIFDANTRAFMGTINVRRTDGEIGFWISEAYRGKGLLEEAIKLITAEYFKCTESPYILAGVNPENIASLKLLLKTGFKFVGVENEESKHHDILKLDNPQLKTPLQ